MKKFRLGKKERRTRDRRRTPKLPTRQHSHSMPAIPNPPARPPAPTHAKTHRPKRRTDKELIQSVNQHQT